MWKLVDISGLLRSGCQGGGCPVSHPKPFWFISGMPCSLPAGGSCTGRCCTASGSDDSDTCECCAVSPSLQAADQVQKCILMPSHALHLDRWKEGKMNLLRQNTLVHFAPRGGAEVLICNGGGKAYCWISVKDVFYFTFVPRLLI